MYRSLFILTILLAFRVMGAPIWFSANTAKMKDINAVFDDVRLKKRRNPDDGACGDIICECNSEDGIVIKLRAVKKRFTPVTLFHSLSFAAATVKQVVCSSLLGSVNTHPLFVLFGVFRI